MVKNLPDNAGGMRDVGSNPGLGRPWRRAWSTRSSILAWRIPWTEEPGGVQSMGLQELTQLIEEHFHFKGDIL